MSTRGAPDARAPTTVPVGLCSGANDQRAADTLADSTAGSLSAYGAEITGAAVGESKDPVPPAGPLYT